MPGYRVKPPAAATLNRADPLARGLVRAWLFDDRGGVPGSWRFRDAIVGDVLTYNRPDSDTFWRSGPAGPAFKAGATGGSGSSFSADGMGSWGAGALSSSFTILTRQMPTGGNPFLTQTLSVARSGGSAGWVLTTGGSSVQFYADADGILKGATGSATVSSGTWYTFGGTYARDLAVSNYAGIWRAYLDGRKLGENNNALGGDFGGTFTNNPLFVGSGTDLNTPDRVIDYVFAWNRALSEREVSLFTADPFRMFRRRSVPVPLSVPAGGPGEITATLAVTQAADTASATAAAQVAAALAATQAGDALSAAAAAAVGATLGAAQAGDAISGTAAVTVTVTATPTQAADTLSAAGAVGIVVTGAPTGAGSTLSGAAAVAIAASLAATQAANTLVATAGDQAEVTGPGPRTVLAARDTSRAALTPRDSSRAALAPADTSRTVLAPRDSSRCEL